MSSNLEQQRRLRTRLAWAGGLLLCTVPLLGFGGTVYGMVQSFEIIDSMKAPKPGDVGRGVRTTLSLWMVALAVGLVGAGLFVPAMLSLHRLNHPIPPNGVAP